MSPEQTPPPKNHTQNHEHTARKNARTALIILGVVICMIGLSFASVPLYRLFCQVTGFAGTTQTAEAFPDEVLDRVVTIKFNADVDQNMPWKFNPEQREIKVRLGQKGITAFHATNKSDQPVTGTAVYNVTPLKVGKYFHKVQCFCFGEQTLAPGEDISMPVLFFVDPEMAKDQSMNDVQTITLSYTFYRAESEELDKAQQAFYNQ